MVYLAFDPGLAKIGVAISHEGKLAEPLTTVEAHDLINQIKPLVERYRPDELIIGEPDPGPVRDLAVILKDEIARFYKGRIVLYSEDLSSKEAVKKMIEGGVAKMKRQKGEHAAAAALILSDYLDSQPVR